MQRILVNEANRLGISEGNFGLLLPSIGRVKTWEVAAAYGRLGLTVRCGATSSVIAVA
jgi:hypothetical protein